MKKKVFLLIFYCSSVVAPSNKIWATEHISQSQDVSLPSNAKMVPTDPSPNKEKEISKREEKKENQIFDQEDIIIGDPITGPVFPFPQQEEDLIPLSFLVSFSDLSLINSPNRSFKLAFLASNQLKVTLSYDMRFKQSRFFACPIIGTSFESYSFKNQYVPDRHPEERTVFLNRGDKVIGPHLYRKDEHEKVKNLLGAHKLHIRYVDFGGELRVHQRPGNYKFGWFAAIGIQFKAPFRAYRVIQYKEDDQTKAQLTFDSYNLQGIRIDGHLRVGTGRGSIYMALALRNLVNEKKWEKIEGKEVQIYPFMIGLAFDFF